MRRQRQRWGPRGLKPGPNKTCGSPQKLAVKPSLPTCGLGAWDCQPQEPSACGVQPASASLDPLPPPRDPLPGGDVEAEPWKPRLLGL